MVLGEGGAAPPALDGFVDSLLQKFENCRAGLTDETLARGPVATERFFVDLYAEETSRLRDVIRQQEPHLSAAAHDELFRKVDDLVHKVVVPGYVRLSHRYSQRERNGFYALPEGLHGVERLLWAVAGMAIGGFVIWAPFIPIWSKEWVLPFAMGGLLFPELRRWLSVRRFERELNGLVQKADREIGRIDTAYLTDATALAERDAGAGAEAARLSAARAASRQEAGPGEGRS